MPSRDRRMLPESPFPNIHRKGIEAIHRLYGPDGYAGCRAVVCDHALGSAICGRAFYPETEKRLRPAFATPRWRSQGWIADLRSVLGMCPNVRNPGKTLRQRIGVGSAVIGWLGSVYRARGIHPIPSIRIPRQETATVPAR